MIDPLRDSLLEVLEVVVSQIRIPVVEPFVKEGLKEQVDPEQQRNDFLANVDH